MFSPADDEEPGLTSVNRHRTEAGSATVRRSSSERIIEAGAAIADSPASDLLFQYSPLCSVHFPYSDPREDRWQAKDGKRHLLIRAREVLTPQGEFITLGIPYGPRPRVSLIQLNDYAMKQKTRFIEVDHSLRLFLRKMGLSNDGRTAQSFKLQMQRLVAADFTFAEIKDAHRTVQSPLVSKFEMWHQNDAEQRLIWPEHIELSEFYFEGLTEHAVPLDMRAVRALQMSSVKLDIYTWLASRLYRVKSTRPQFIPWPGVRGQFPLKGKGMMSDYRRCFIANLRSVLAVYPDARVFSSAQGVRLQHSPPPVHRRVFVGHTF